MRSSSDQLLDEYLRVINHKDSEIHRLLTEVETLQLELRKKEDRYKSRLRDLKVEIDHFQTTSETMGRELQTEGVELARLRSDNAALTDDVATLRAALQKSDDQLQGLLKASAKAQKHEAHARNKLEAEYSTAKGTLEERLREALDRCAVLDTRSKDLTRWQVETQRLQHELAESQRVIKEMKRRHRELIPKESHVTEVAQIEDRHRQQLGGTERELDRLRGESREEGQRAARGEVVIGELRGKVKELDLSLAAANRHAHDMELALAHEKLGRAQNIEELRFELGAEAKNARERADRALHERSTYEAELAVARRHVQDLEASARGTAVKFRDTEQTMLGEIQTLRTSLSDTQIDLEATRRLSHQHELALAKSQAKLETIREELRDEVGRMKSELQRAEDSIARLEAAGLSSDKTIEELKMQVASAHADVSAERTAALRKEQEWRNKLIVADEQLRLKDEEKRKQAETYEATLRQRENEFLYDKNQRVREYQKTSTDTTLVKQELEDRIQAADAQTAHTRAELLNLRQELDVKLDKERSLSGTIKQQDELILRLQLDMSERDACIVTLRRNLTASSTAQQSTEDSVVQLNASLDVERRRLHATERKLDTAEAACAKKDEELGEIAKQMRRLEEAARARDGDFKRDVEQLRERLQVTSAELHASQQQMAVNRIELERVQVRSADERSSMQREVLGPLQSRVEVLVTTNQKLSREVQEREEKSVELARSCSRLQEQLAVAQGELTLRERRVATLSTEVSTASEQLTSARRLQAQANSEKEDHRRTRSELDSAVRKITALEQQVELLSKELSEFKDRDFDLTHELNTKKAELATLRERYANLESLKAINDGTVTELQSRERELLEKLEEMRSAQQMMQMCFDKQQEQLELGRRMVVHSSTTQSGGTVTRTVQHEESSVTRRKLN